MRMWTISIISNKTDKVTLINIFSMCTGIDNTSDVFIRFLIRFRS